MTVSSFTRNIGLKYGALAIEHPLETLRNRALLYLDKTKKYSYTLKDLIAPLERSIQALVFSLFTGSLLQHLKLYGKSLHGPKHTECFFHTNGCVKAEAVNEKYDRFFVFYNPNWEEMKKHYIGPLKFSSTEEFADHVTKNVALFLKTAADKKCPTDKFGILLTPLHRYFSSADRKLEEKKRFIDKLPESTEMFTCTQLQTRAFLYAGVDLFPNQTNKGIYPNDFSQSHNFTLLS